MLFRLDLLELEDRARAPTAAVGLLDVDVALLALPPTLAGTRAPWHRAALASDVLDGRDLVGALAARRRHLDLVPFLLTDQRSRDRRADREQTVLDVGLVLADDLILGLATVGGVDEMNRGAEDDLATGVHGRDVDDLRIRELRFDVADPRFHEALLLLGRVVLGVFFQVAVCARGCDCRSDLRALLDLQPAKLLLELRGAARRQGHLAHTDASACRSCSRFTTTLSRWSNASQVALAAATVV